MKSLMIAGALLHTFSQAPMPNRAVASNTVNFKLDWETVGYYGNDQQAHKILVEKYRNNKLGIYDCDIRKITYQRTGEDIYHPDAVIIYGVLNNYTVNTVSDLNIQEYFNAYTTLENVEYAIAYGQGNQSLTEKALSDDYIDLVEFLDDWMTNIDHVEDYDINQTWYENMTIETPQNNLSFMIGITQQYADNEYVLQCVETQISYTYSYNIPDTEVIDVGGLFWEILAMPFAFISQAFNLTIFPNTPYSINIANVLFAVISALVVLYVIKRFTR